MKLRTNIRRVFIVVILLWSHPELYPFLIGAGLVVIGQIIHFISAGYLTKQSELTTAGPYRFVRNPFYAGNILTDIGLCLMANNPYVAAIFLPLFYLVVIPRRVKKEEKFLSEKFGNAYVEFCNKVPRFFPRLWPAKLDKISGCFSWGQIIKYREIWRVMRAFGLVIIFYLQYRIGFDLINNTARWNDLLNNSVNMHLLIVLAIIIIIPPIIQFGFISKKR
ncbi:MAG: isoprenylcysteine carboxylmethyltransferase family protein [Planctomycetes bacterium]|nr:isoprenylcysteine carboxylmethyltransferase family protein [Planctomycetota bacterium]